MTTLIAIAALGSWTYDGFVAEPSAAPTIASRDNDINVPLSPVPEPPLSKEADRQPFVDPEPEKTSPESPIVPEDVAQPEYDPGSGNWRLKDRSGQLWEHTDRSWLMRWIQQRDLTLPAQKNP